MGVERDMAGIALPFAAGVASAVFSEQVSQVHPALSSATACLLLLTMLSILSHPLCNALPQRHTSILTALCMASCGLLCGITAIILSVSGSFTDGLTEHIGTYGRATGDMIDSIGFRNPETNAILKALIIGDRSDIPVHITEAFRSSGASHILALSGFHLGIIYGILSKSLSIIGNTPYARTVRSVAIIIVCGLYTLAVGAGASIVRAFLFILVGEAAGLSGRFRSTGTILLTVLMLHLVLDPLALREVGFQLSYAAMAGIAFIFPRLKRFWPATATRPKAKRPLMVIWNSLVLSVSCQITTGPLAYLYFRSFPTHFLITNLIALPLTGFLIPAALLTLALDASGFCPEIMIKATEMLVTALSVALEIIASM